MVKLGPNDVDLRLGPFQYFPHRSHRIRNLNAQVARQQIARSQRQQPHGSARARQDLSHTTDGAVPTRGNNDVGPGLECLPRLASAGIICQSLTAATLQAPRRRRAGLPSGTAGGR